LQRAINDNEKLKAHKIATESLSVREFMSNILKHLNENGNVVLDRVPLISGTKKRAKLIVIFLAILELAKEGSIEISQSSFNGPIWILKNK
jgi:segregation and condensation protein A